MKGKLEQLLQSEADLTQHRSNAALFSPGKELNVKM